MNLIYNTGLWSLRVQVLTFLFDILVVFYKRATNSFIKNLLWIEIFVQMIEGAFYGWMVNNFANIKNITEYRYYDWVITTPSMLFTYSMYLYHIHNPIDNRTFFQIVDANIFTLFPIFILNTCMLFFGYLAEKGFTDFITGAILGFVPFIVMFKMIYEHYAKESTIGRITFAYFVGVWSLYGFASLFSYTYKNIFYNILDLLSKNVFGIFLAIVLLLSPNK